MNDYSKLTDGELNFRIAIVQGFTCWHNTRDDLYSMWPDNPDRPGALKRSDFMKLIDAEEWLRIVKGKTENNADFIRFLEWQGVRNNAQEWRWAGELAEQAHISLIPVEGGWVAQPTGSLHKINGADWFEIKVYQNEIRGRPTRAIAETWLQWWEDNHVPNV